MIMRSPAWVVKEVQPKEDYTLLLTFADGTIKRYNARPLLEKAIYAPLKDLAFFMCARAECGTVVWNDDIDIAPECLWANGVPVSDEMLVDAFMEKYAAALDAGVDDMMEECAGDEFPPELDARCRALIEQAGGKSGEAERAWQSFIQNYLPEIPEDLIDPSTGTKLTPSPGGRECLGNGEWPGYEICCDECDHFFTCFPEA